MEAKSIAINKTKIITFAILLTIIAVMPAFLHTQWFTGPLVNAILILTTLLVGTTEAMILGLIPSIIALSAGLLPLTLAPMVPFIMLSNSLYIISFSYLQKINKYFALLTASALKFALLLLSVNLIMTTLLSEQLVGKLYIMMSWPQLITAVAGGLIAFAIMKTIKK